MPKTQLSVQNKDTIVRNSLPYGNYVFCQERDNNQLVCFTREMTPARLREIAKKIEWIADRRTKGDYHESL